MTKLIQARISFQVRTGNPQRAGSKPRRALMRLAYVNQQRSQAMAAQGFSRRDGFYGHVGIIADGTATAL